MPLGQPFPIDGVLGELFATFNGIGDRRPSRRLSRTCLEEINGDVREADLLTRHKKRLLSQSRDKGQSNRCLNQISAMQECTIGAF
jgi:hypothetical protein